MMINNSTLDYHNKFSRWPRIRMTLFPHIHYSYTLGVVHIILRNQFFELWDKFGAYKIFRHYVTVQTRLKAVLTRAIALNESGRICQLHFISNNNLSTLVTSCFVYSGYNFLLVDLIFDLCLLLDLSPKQESSLVWSYSS